MTNIQKILEIGLEEYLEKNKTIGYKQKVIKAIKNCKSDKLGAHKYVCDECGYEEIAYNSCRNRHCPNCQIMKKLKWIEARKEEVLNIKYYHVVFTIPSELYNIVYQNQRFMDNVQVVRLLNDVIEINPQDIKDIDFDLNISQSLSSGTADTRRRSLNNALAMMIEIGEPRSLTDSVRIRNLMAKILEESGLKDTENYLISAERLRQQVQNDETA